MRPERCPTCWNPLSTLAALLSALGDMSKLYRLSQHQPRRTAGDEQMFPVGFKTLMRQDRIWEGAEGAGKRDDLPQRAGGRSTSWDA